MRRRQFIALLGGAAAAWPLAARAQQSARLARVGYLTLVPTAPSRNYDAFQEGLRDLGYVEGRNLHIEYRSTEGDEGRLPALLAELIGLNVDVIVTYANGVTAALHATTTIPIVMAVGADLVAMGVVANLAHPGRNVTGSTFFFPELMAKRLELLKELSPSMTRAGALFLFRREDNASANVLQVMETTAKALKLGLRPIEVRGPNEFESAFSTWADEHIGGFVMSDHGLLNANAAMIAALAAKHRLPSIGPLELPANGGLMGYGVNFPDLFRRAAYFVDMILKGARPGDIPIEQATRFKSVVNLKTAKALGLDVPATLLARADEVIE